jgi:hypothetical protein
MVAVTTGALPGRASDRAMSWTSSGLSFTMRRNASSETLRLASFDSRR